MDNNNIEVQKSNFKDLPELTEVPKRSSYVCMGTIMAVQTKQAVGWKKNK